MLLSLRNVTKRFPRGRRGAERVPLRGVSLDVAAGDFVAVWGPRRSGRTTLLDVCAGLERPTEGAVAFNGHEVADLSLLGARGGVGYCHDKFSRMYGVVVEQVAMPLMRTVSVGVANARAQAALERVGVADCSELTTNELEPWELARVVLARAIVTEPRVVLVDAPTAGLAAPEQDRVLELLRSLTKDEGIGVLMTVDEVPSAVDRLLSIHDGVVRGDVMPTVAPVVPLRPARAEPSA